MKNYYEILGVADKATNDEIKKAYRELAKQYHPDTNPDAEAQEKMQEVNEAWETLSDKKKKKEYDTKLHADPYDIFSNVHFRSYHTPHYPMHVDVEMEVTMEDIYNNREIIKTYKRYVPCNACHGSGIDNNGRACSTCKGETTVLTDETCRIPSGNVRKNQVVDIAGMGNFIGLFSGALRLHIKIVPSNYTIVGTDLYYELQLHYEDAINGIEYPYTHLDGKEYQIKIPPKSNTGQKMRMSKKGLKGSWVDKGDLYFIITIYINYDRINEYNNNEQQQTEQL